MDVKRVVAGGRIRFKKGRLAFDRPERVRYYRLNSLHDFDDEF